MITKQCRCNEHVSLQHAEPTVSPVNYDFKIYNESGLDLKAKTQSAVFAGGKPVEALLRAPAQRRVELRAKHET